MATVEHDEILTELKSILAQVKKAVEHLDAIVGITTQAVDELVRIKSNTGITADHAGE
jgi:hypothetical protein